MNLTDLAGRIIDLSGSKENIISVTHCMTRLRIRVKNEDKFLVDELNELDGVISVIFQNNEYQIVIGPNVNKLYRVVTEQLGIVEEEMIEENLDKNKISRLEKFMGTISAIFVPLIGIIAASGTFKGLLALSLQLNWLTSDSSTYVLLYGLANAIFYFFPVMLGYTTASHFKGNPFLGAILGASIMTPTIVELAGSDVSASLFGINFSLLNYSNTVLPVIFGAWLIAKCQKFFEKYLPSVTQIVFVPLFSMLISFCAVMFFIGPLMTVLNDGMSKGVLFMHELSPVLSGAILGGLWQATILIGIGWGFVPIFLGNIATLGYSPILGTLAGSAWAQVGAALAVSLRTKNKKMKAVGLSAVFSGAMGVTEPAIYGINFPAKKPFFIALFSGGVGGAIAAVMGAKQYAIGPSGIFQIAVFINPEKGIDQGFIAFIISILVSFVLAFVLTYFFGYQNTIVTETKDRK